MKSGNLFKKKKKKNNTERITLLECDGPEKKKNAYDQVDGIRKMDDESHLFHFGFNKLVLGHFDFPGFLLLLLLPALWRASPTLV